MIAQRCDELRLTGSGGANRVMEAEFKRLVMRSPFELRIDKRPGYNNLGAALSLARVSQYGEVYWAAESDDSTIGGRDWLRTRFHYAYKSIDADSPKVATGIEYATLNGGLVYVVTFHGSEKDAESLRALIAPTLAVDANHPAAIRKD